MTETDTTPDETKTTRRNLVNALAREMWIAEHRRQNADVSYKDALAAFKADSEAADITRNNARFAVTQLEKRGFTFTLSEKTEV